MKWNVGLGEKDCRSYEKKKQKSEAVRFFSSNTNGFISVKPLKFLQRKSVEETVEKRNKVIKEGKEESGPTSLTSGFGKPIPLEKGSGH